MFRQVLILLLLLPSLTFSQEDELVKVDSVTYKLYLSGSWNDLINEGSKAIDNGIDFYYLRARMGIAYFEKQNFMKASHQFRKALEFSPRDEFASEYYYYSLLNSGKFDEAEIIASGFSSSLKKKIGFKKSKIIRSVFTEDGFSINENYDDMKKNDIAGSQNIYGEQNILKNYYYLNFGATLKPGERTRIYAGYSYFIYNFTQQIDEIVDGLMEYDHKSKYHNLFLLTSITPAIDWNLIFSLNAGFINDSYYSLSYTYPGNIPSTNYRLEKIDYNSITGHAAVYKSFSLFKAGYNFYYSNLNEGKHFQNGLELVYYPLGNLKLYSVSNFTIQNSENKNNSTETNFIYDQKIGFNLLKNFWIEGYYTAGTLSNFFEGNGFVQFNNQEKIKSRFGGNIIYSLFEDRLLLSLRYRNTKNENSFITYTDLTNFTTSKNNFRLNTLIGGIQWYF
jgi:hypothetical protein